MSEKLRPNFTPVPNVIFDSVMRTLHSGPLKVLLAICRYTYGWGKQADRISLAQLAEMTNMDRSNVHRAIRELGPLVVVKPGDPARNLASEYRLNIQIPDADLLSIRQRDLLSEEQHPVVRPVVTSATIQRNPKKEDKSGAKAPNSLSAIVEKTIRRLNELAGTDYKTRTKATQTCIHARLADGFTEADLITVVEFKWANWQDNPKMQIYYRPETLFGSKFEGYLQAAKLNGHGAPSEPVVKDLGNGMLEVDGTKMPRETFEARYGRAN